MYINTTLTLPLTLPLPLPLPQTLTLTLPLPLTLISDGEDEGMDWTPAEYTEQETPSTGQLPQHPQQPRVSRAPLNRRVPYPAPVQRRVTPSSDSGFTTDDYSDDENEIITFASLTPGFVNTLPSPSHFDSHGNIIYHIGNLFKRTHTGPEDEATDSKRVCFGADGIAERFTVPQDMVRPSVSAPVQALAAPIHMVAAPVQMVAAPVQVVAAPVIERAQISVVELPDRLMIPVNTSGNEPQPTGATPTVGPNVPSPRVYRPSASNIMHLEPLFYVPDSKIYKNEKK